MIEQFIKDVEDLLEWMPVCSVGSTGHTRRTKVEAGLDELKASLRTKYVQRYRTTFWDILRGGGVD
jgi:hypothetical protein